MRQLSVFVCDRFYPELSSFLRDNPMQDRIRLQALPGDCRSYSGAAGAIHEDALVLGGPCIRGGRLQTDGCFGLIAPDWLADNLVREGAFLVSPGWLVAREDPGAACSLDPAGLKEFDRETMTKICLLDTLVLPDSERRLGALSGALGVPAMRIPVGMDHCAGRLRKLIADRLDAVPEEAVSGSEVRPQADYAMALDLFSQFNLFQTEAEGIQRLLHIFSMLFAPGMLYLIRFAGPLPAGTNRLLQAEGDVDEADMALCAEVSGIRGLSDREGTLAVPLDFQGQRIALVILKDIDQRRRERDCRSLLEAIAPICALSLDNARNFEVLRQNETALRSKQEDLLRALGLRDRLFSIIGHDLRGPIGAILGLLEYLEADLAPVLADTQREVMTEVVLSVHRALFLLTNLLEWGRSERSMVHLHPESLEVKRLAMEAFLLLKSQADAKRISVRNEVAGDFRILADQTTISTVLRNLLSNALKFTPAGGSVTIGSEIEGTAHRLTVSDTGVGMDAVALSRALDPADRSSARGTAGERGTGLGLLLCRDFTELNGGSIRLDSEPGKGTRVTLEFPRA